MATYIITRSQPAISGEFEDVKYFCNTTQIRKKFNLKGRGKIVGIRVRTIHDPNFINKANKDIKYKYPLFSSEWMDGAYEDWVCGGSYKCFLTNHPIGDVWIVLNE